MKSYKYMGIIYHKKTWFYYMNDVSMKFKTHELICDWIEDFIMGEF
jgi:hypothetical protein